MSQCTTASYEQKEIYPGKEKCLGLLTALSQESVPILQVPVAYIASEHSVRKDSFWSEN